MAKITKSLVFQKSLPLFNNPLVLIFFFFFLFYLFFAGGHIYTFDGWAMHLTTRAIIEDGSLVIPSKIDVNGELVIPHGRIGRNGSFYSQYGLFFSVVEIPFYLLGRLLDQSPFGPVKFVSLFVNPFLSSLVCIVIFVFAQKLHYSKKTSLLLVLIYGLSTMALVWSQLFVNRPLSTLLLLASACYLHERQPVHAGVLTGLCLLTRLTNLIALPFFLCYLLSQSPKSKSIFLYLFPIVCALAIQGFLNLICFGRLFSIGYDLQSEKFGAASGVFKLTASRFLDGAFGLLFSPGRGLFIFCPVLLLFPLALKEFFKKHKKEALFFTGLVVVFYLVFAIYYNWHGGRPWGPKHLFETIPFAVLALGSALEKYLKNPYFKFWLFTLFIAGFLINLMAALVNYHDSGRSGGEILYLFVPSESILVDTWQFIIQGKWDMLLVQQNGWPFIILEMLALSLILLKLGKVVRK